MIRLAERFAIAQSAAVLLLALAAFAGVLNNAERFAHVSNGLAVLGITGLVAACIGFVQLCRRESSK